MKRNTWVILLPVLACSSQKAHLESRLAELCSINQQSAAVGYADSLVSRAKLQELSQQIQQDKETDTTTYALLMYALFADSTWRFTCNKTTLRRTVDSVLGMSPSQRQEAYQALGQKALEEAIVASMRSDLRNLVTAEEAYFADHVRYTSNLSATVLSSTTDGNTLSAITLTKDGWYATMTNPRTTKTCAIFIGSVPVAPATKEGWPECQ